ncbi:MAG: hypothetical protein ACK559_40860, partial [bacterium]
MLVLHVEAAESQAPLRIEHPDHHRDEHPDRELVGDERGDRSTADGRADAGDHGCRMPNVGAADTPA